MPTSESVVTVTTIRRDVVSVDGPEAVGYLQGQLSQDVSGLAVGEAGWSLLLQPTGKVDAWLRLWREQQDLVRLDVDAGFGDAVAARLSRFKLRTKAEIRVTVDQPMVAVRGIELAGGLPCGWPGLRGSDHPGSGRPVGLPADAVELDADGFEALRIAHGVPAMGAELTEATIPAEAGQWLIDASVSFTKGCYTGQELVARIDSRGGNVPRPIRLVVADASFAAGVSVIHDGQAVGFVTSATRDGDRWVGLAPISRAVPAGAAVDVGGQPGVVS